MAGSHQVLIHWAEKRIGQGGSRPPLYLQGRSTRYVRQGASEPGELPAERRLITMAFVGNHGY